MDPKEAQTEVTTPPPAAPVPSGGAPPKTIIAVAGVTLVVALALYPVLTRRGGRTGEAARPGLTLNNGAVELHPAAPEWRYLDLAVAAPGAALAPVPAPARVVVEESRAAPIFSPLPGRVEVVSVQLGQHVKVGERLVAIRSVALPELNREEESAKAALAVKNSMVERVRDLVKLNAVPQKDLIAAEQERREAELALKASEGKRRNLHLGAVDDSGLYWITATHTGTVIERRALVGMEVGPDRTDPLVSIADLGQVVVVADVLESDTVGLAVGDKARVVSPGLGSDGAEGTIKYVAQFVDPVRRTVDVRVLVPNPDHKLRPNAFAQVVFSAGAEQRIVVPGEAVVTDDQKAIVFVKTPGPGGGGRLERREVRVGRARDGKTEILSGLAPGETYVARGALLILNAVDLAR